MNSLPDDEIWRALAHPLRRRVLDVLRDGPLSSGEIVVRLDTSRHVALQHLAILREADLVLVEKRGRSRLNYLNSVPLQTAIGRWLSPYEQDWAAALVGLRDTVEVNNRKGNRSHANDKDVRSA